MELKDINVEGLERYQITEDGQVFNKITKRWVKPYRTNLKYYCYGLTCSINKKRKNYFAHRLVAFTFLGNPVDLSFEVDHIDEDKGNNHYSNLQWISHSANITKSFRLGKRGAWWKDKSRPSFTIEHRRKMANAKLKAVNIYHLGKLVKKAKSIADTAIFLKLTRVSIWFILKNKEGIYKDYELKVMPQQ